MLFFLNEGHVHIIEKAHILQFFYEMDKSNTKTEDSVFSPDSKGLQSLLNFLKKRAFQDPNLSLGYIDEGLKIANRYIDPSYRLDLLTYKGGILIQKGLFPHALSIFEEALDIASRVRDNISISRIHNNLGLIYKSQEKYTKALEMFSKSLKFGESKQNPYIYSNIGSILYIREDWDKALQYFTNALYLAEKHNDVQILCVCCINIGDFHKQKGNYSKAINYLERGLAIAKEHDEFILHKGMFLQIIGSTFGLMNAYDDAIEYIDKANNIFRKHGFFLNLSQALIEIAELYYNQKDFIKSKKCLDESITICNKYDYTQEIINALKLQIKCATVQGDLEETNKLLQSLVECQHHHFTKEKDLKVKEVLTSMENEVDVLIKKNQEIEQKNNLLEASNKELKQYAYIIAHDLKEPLRNINSFTNLLGKYSQENLSEDSKEFMSIIEQNAEMMSKKLDDLLGYVAIKLDPTLLQLVDVENLVYKVLNVLQRELQDHKIMLELGKMINLFVIPAQLRMLFYHLIKNAIQYLDPEKDFHSINISSVQNGDLIEYCVEDNGIGINSAYHKKIFMIFKQIERYGNGGTGIGLAVCEKIVRLYNGQIRVESKLGAGTKVIFTMKQLKS